MLKRFLLIPLAAALLLAGCSTNNVDPFLNDPPDYIYATGHIDLQKADYNDALKAYQSLDSQYPFNPLTQKGDLESIYAYYENDNPAMAVTAASRYTKIYPSDKNLDYAYYIMGVVDFENGRGFLQKYFPYNMGAHNAPNYTTAYNYFNTVVTTYPDSPYAYDARRRMIYLNNVQAHFQINAADLDYQLGAYVASANRAQQVILNYPTSPVTEEALNMMIQSYNALVLTNLAQSSEQVLKLNFSSNS